MIAVLRTKRPVKVLVTVSGVKRLLSVLTLVLVANLVPVILVSAKDAIHEGSEYDPVV